MFISGANRLKDSHFGAIAFPGTFDPVNNGHTNLIRKAYERNPDATFVIIFQDNPGKSERLINYENSASLFSLALAKTIQRPVTMIDSHSSEELLKNIKGYGVTHVIRGFRSRKDLAYEFMVAGFLSVARRTKNRSSFNVALVDNRDSANISSTQVRKQLYAPSINRNELERLVEPAVATVLTKAHELAPPARSRFDFNKALSYVLTNYDQLMAGSTIPRNRALVPVPNG